MLSRLLARAAPPVVALSLIALIPTLALMGRLGLLTDPATLASFVLVLGFLAVGLVTTVRRVGIPSDGCCCGKGSLRDSASPPPPTGRTTSR